ncbi:hypothetical protein MASR2M17_06330 [Aminivibrio sp.]
MNLQFPDPPCDELGKLGTAIENDDIVQSMYTSTGVCNNGYLIRKDPFYPQKGEQKSPPEHMFRGA